MTSYQKKVLIISILTILLAAFPFSLYSKDTTDTRLEKTDFAFAGDCLSSEPKKLCLVGKFKAGIEVTLLQGEPRKTCAAKTTSKVNEFEPSGAFLTELDGSCNIPKEYSVAVLKKPIRDYERLTSKKIVNVDIVSKTDKLVRKSGALVKLIEKAREGEMKELEAVIPQIHQFSLPDFNVIIASYDEFPNNQNYVPGPRVILIKDRVYPLTGWCSYFTFYIFRLNGQHYVQTGSCCCGCGITIMELFRITPNGLIEVYSNGDLSD